MSTQQWEIGHGRVWTFEASNIVTSGDVVKFAPGTNDTILPVQATGDRSLGVCLFPASKGKLAAVALDMIVYVNMTGGGTLPSAGCYLMPASAGTAIPLGKTPGITDCENIIGRVIEGNATKYGRPKVKLIWG